MIKFNLLSLQVLKSVLCTLFIWTNLLFLWNISVDKSFTARVWRIITIEGILTTGLFYYWHLLIVLHCENEKLITWINYHNYENGFYKDWAMRKDFNFSEKKIADIITWCAEKN